MTTKPDYKLLHKLRRGAAHMTRDELLLKLHEAEKVIRTCEGFRALAIKRGQDFIDAVRAMDIARERVTEANAKIEQLKSELDNISNQKDVLLNRVARLEDQRDVLINVIDKITGTE
jgi:chromosome segregation ATPase